MSEELQQAIAAIVESEQPKEQATTPETVENEEVKPTEQEQADEKTFTQAQLDEIVKKRISKLERKLERQRADESRAQVEQNPVAVELGEKPKAEDYADYAEFLEALAEHKAEEKLIQRENSKKEAAIKEQQEAEVKKHSELRRNLMESGEDKYDDFEEVVKASKLRIAEPAYLAILESDVSSELVYHLAKDADEAERISKLSPYSQAKEIGKLEEKLAAKQPIKKSDAPKPISPVNGSKDFSKRYEDMTIAEIEADAVKRGAKWA